MRPLRAALPALALAFAMLGGGCALLPGDGRPGEPVPRAASALPEPGAEPLGAASRKPQAQPMPMLRVEVEAPGSLKPLLERFLDLSRLPQFVRDDVVSGNEWSRLIDAAPAQARDLLQTEGYFTPEITVQRQPPAAEGEERVRIVVVPGPRSAVTRFTLLTAGELDVLRSQGDALAKATYEDLVQRFGLPPGTAFRNADWNDAKAATLARLRAAGYALASWSGTAAEVDAEQAGVRLFAVIDSGPLFRFGRLRVEGLVTHDEATVGHLADLAAGEAVTDTRLLDFQERLQKSGLFESVTVTLEPEADRAAASTVLVRLREAPLQVYTFGVGVSNNTGPRASVEHAWRRVFGAAATSRNKAEWGQRRQAWDGEISTHPGEDQYRNLLGGAIERLESTSDLVVSQRLRLGRTQDTTRIERLYFVEAERAVRRTLAEPSVRSRASALSLNYHGIWRDLDSVILPTEGVSVALQGGVGQARSGLGTSPFTRLYGRLTGYLPLGSTWYGQARVEIGKVSVRQGIEVPETQQFRAGGDDSVRGYGYRSLGPLVDGAVSGGNALLTASVEVARPISLALPSLWGAVFADAGNAATSFAALDPALGVGAGLRWRSPVGPLRVDWAWARELKRGRLHFSVAIAF
jgi:translocation and assembly module TamA